MTTIELTGMVGAGKSTAAGLLRSDLRARGYTVFDLKAGIRAAMDRSVFGTAVRRLGLAPSAQERVLMAVYKAVVRPSLITWLAVRRPWLVRSVIGAAVRSPLSLRHRCIIVGLTVRPAAALPFVTGRLRTGDVLLLEEGPVHRAVNLFAWGPSAVDPASVRTYLERVPRSDVVVLVDAPRDVCAARARSRGFPARLRDRDDDSIRRFMDGSATVVEVIAAFLAEAGARVVVVDNSHEGAAGAGDALRAALDAARLGDGGHVEASTPRATTPRFEASRRWAVPRPHTPFRGPRSPVELDVLGEVLAAFGLSVTGDVRPIPGQSRADNLIVPTPLGDKLIKRYKSTVAASSIEHEHAVLEHLRRRQFPSPRLHEAQDGRTSVELGGRRYAAFDHEPQYFHYNEYLWLPNQRRRFVELSGRALAGLHAALSDFVPSVPHPLGFVASDGPRARELDWYLARLCDAGDPGTVDGGGAHLDDEGRELWSNLQRHRQSVVDQLRAIDGELHRADLPRQVIHGDYGPYNILFKAGERVLVVDFEMARIDWRIIDIAKSAQQFAVNRLGYRPDRLDAFLSGYLSAGALDAEELQLLTPVWRFLHLRRVVVCWSLFCETGDVSFLRESERKLELADLPIGIRHASPETV